MLDAVDAEPGRLGAGDLVKMPRDLELPLVGLVDDALERLFRKGLVHLERRCAVVRPIRGCASSS